jgi:Na+/melibiose symporter-like transporter
MADSRQELSTGYAIRYGLLAAPLAFAALPLYVYVPMHYASAGLGLGMIGLILLCVRLGDAVTDPFFGWLADRTSPKRLIVLAMPVLALGMFLLFGHRGTNDNLAVWLVVSLVLTHAGWGLATVAYQALGVRASVRPRDQRRLVSWREGFGLGGILMASLAPLALADDLATGLASSTVLFLALLLIAVLVSPSPAAANPGPSQWGGGSSLRAWAACFVADRRFTVLLTVALLNGLAAAVAATLFLFVVQDVLVLPDAAGGFMAAYFFAAALALPLWAALAERRGPLFAWRVAMLVALAGFSLALGLGEGRAGLFLLVCVGTGIAFGADVAMPAMLVSALAADAEKKHGRSLAGSYYGLWNFVIKLSMALAAAVSLPLLALAGYEPATTQGNGILLWAYCGLPLLLKGAACWYSARLAPRQVRPPISNIAAPLQRGGGETPC